MIRSISNETADKAIVAALNGLMARQKAIANNLANVDTPGFKASEVRFEERLREALAREGERQPIMLVTDHPRHISTTARSVDLVKPEVIRLANTTNRIDGNNVDIDREMVKLAETTLSYNALVQLISSRIALGRYLINEGRR